MAEKTRVVICDDTPAQRALVRAMLAAAPDVEIVGEATDGATCLTSIAVTRPDVVVLDLHMPGQDGFDVLEALRDRADRPRILVLSSAPAEDVRPKVLAAGADFLSKGIAADELAAAVRRLAA